MPALPRNCKRNEIHKKPLNSSYREGVESRMPQARRLYGGSTYFNPEGERRRTMKKVFVFVLLFSVVAFFSPVQAQNKNEPDPIRTMSEIVVTATRDNQEVRKTPANITVITAKEIEQSGATTLVEVLNKLESINFRDYSGNSPQSLIDLRGFGGDNPYGKTLVLLDGRRLNRPDMSSVNWLQIPVSQIEKIEVVRGAGSVLYGDMAIAGIINVLTKKGKGEPKVNTSVIAGSYGLSDERVGISGSTGKLSYALNGGNLFSWGYRERSKSSSQGGGIKLGYDASDYFRISVDASANQNSYLLPGALTKDQMIQYRRQYQPGHDNDDGMDRDASFHLRLESILGSYGRFDLDFIYGDKTIAANMDSWWQWTTTDIKTYTVSPKYILDKPIRGHDNKLTVGLDYYTEPYKKDFFSSRERIAKSSWTDLRRNSLGCYVRNEFSLLPVLILDAGYRTERTNMGGSHTDSATPANSFTDKDKKYDAEAYEAGINWLIGRQSKLFTKYSTIYRIPFLDEVASFNGGGGGFLTSLEKERGASMEIGTQFNPLQNLKIGFTVFRIDMEDEIQYVGSFPTGYNQNTGKTRHEGAEFSFSYSWEKWVRFYGNATYHSATFEDGANNKKEMPLVPNRMANFGVEINLPWQLTLRPEMRYVSNCFLSGDNANTGEKLDPHTVFNVYLLYRPTWGKIKTTAFLGVENLTDLEYAVAGYDGRPWSSNTYYPMPGISVKGGLSLEF